MAMFDVLFGIVLGVIICVAFIYGAGYRIAKR